MKEGNPQASKVPQNPMQEKRYLNITKQCKPTSKERQKAQETIKSQIKTYSIYKATGLLIKGRTSWPRIPIEELLNTYKQLTESGYPLEFLNRFSKELKNLQQYLKENDIL